METEQASRLSELVALLELNERDARMLALILAGTTDYHVLADELGIAPTVASTARTRLRKRITIAAAEAEERTRLQAQDQADAERYTGAYGFYAALLECFGNVRNASPRTPQFKNVKQDCFSEVLTGDEIWLTGGQLVTADDLMRARRKRAA